MSVDFTSSFSIKPDTSRVSEIKALNEFIEDYPDEELTPNLKKLGERYKYYRAINGDGNCFYRACVFLYFSTAKLEKFSDTFPTAPIKNCTNLPFDLEQYDVQQVLNFIWKTYLLPIKEMNEYQRKRQLLRRLNGSVMLDAFLIAYFRSLNHQYLIKNREKFLSYIEGNFQKEIDLVLNFGRQSQGIELFAMAELLRVKITIMMVHKENYQQIVYMEQGRHNFVLFYRPGHYDILCDESQYRYLNSNRFSNTSSNRSFVSSSLSSRKSEENVVRINSIEDLGKTQVSNLLGDKKKNLKPSNLSEFKQNKEKKDKQYNQTKKIYVSHNGKPHTPQKQAQQKQKASSIRKSSESFPKQNKAVSNVNNTRIVIEGGLVGAVIALICWLAYNF